MSDIGKNLLKLTFALLKHRAKKEFGEETLGIAAETLVEIGGDKAKASLEAVLGTKDGTAKLLEAAQKADEYFRNKCEDNDLRQVFTISMGDLPSVQAELIELPTGMDEDSLLKTLRNNLHRDFPKLTKDQIESGVTLYADCLHRSLLPLEEFTLQIIGQAVLDNKSKLNEIGSEVQIIKSLLERLPHREQKTVASESAIFKTQVYALKPWIQPLFLNDLDDKFNNSPSKLSDLIISNPRIVVVGNSGSGKTEALKMAANELNQSSDVKCFWIPLKNYITSLSHTIKTILGLHDLQDDQVLRVLQEYKITLLLDGLNEVTNENLDNCVNEINSLLDTYQGQICISHSINDLAYFGFEHPTYKTMPLNKAQIEKTVMEFFGAKELSHRAGWFLQSVRGHDLERQKDFDKLAELPINLQFFLELAEEEDFVFNSTLDLYGQLIQKRLERTKSYTKRNQFTSEIKTDCLINLAYEAIIKDNPLQMQKEFVRSVFLKTIGSAKSKTDLALQETIRAGLLIEINEFLLEWPHSSFRDYLAGRQLFKRIEAKIPFDEFPFDKQNGFTAAAYATRLLTTQSRNPENRHLLFLSLLKRCASFEIIKSVAGEYSSAINYYASTNQSIKYDRSVFLKTKWGERFIEAYNLIKEICIKNAFKDIPLIPLVQGLNVYFDEENNFCLIVFSQNEGINCDSLEFFNHQVSHRTRRKNSKTGFCIFAPFLQLLDPEIVAYLQVGIWLRKKETVDEERLNEWHNGLSIYLSPKKELVYWNEQNPPENNYEISASPEDTIKFMIKHYGADQLREMASIMDFAPKSEKITLSWDEIYMPITFEIDPSKTQESPRLTSTRNGQMMLRIVPNHNISLILLLPFFPAITKIDFGAIIYIPFPVSFLNRYYFLYDSHETFQGGRMSSYFHLRG